MDINDYIFAFRNGGQIQGDDCAANKLYFTVSVDTNGTTPVNVFSSSGAPTGLTVTSVVSIAKDTTAGNILLKNGTLSVALIAKGTTAGALVGATSLSNATYTKGSVCTVESDSAGNSTVVITFFIN